MTVRDVIRGFLAEAHYELLISNEDYVALLDKLDRATISDEGSLGARK